MNCLLIYIIAAQNTILQQCICTGAGISNSVYLGGHMSHVRVTMRAACAHCLERCTQNMMKTLKLL